MEGKNILWMRNMHIQTEFKMRERLNYIKRAEISLMKVRGGVTLEAALIIPIYIFTVSVIINILILLGVEMRVKEAAFESIRETSGRAYLYMSEDSGSLPAGGITLFSIDKNIKQKLAQSGTLSKSIKGGVNGINITSSKILNNNSKIKLNIEYTLNTPFSFFEAANIKVSQNLETYAWLGEDYMEYREDTKYVYVAKHGTVYHLTPHCSYLHTNIYVSNTGDIMYKRNASGAKYYACKRCGNSGIVGTVFYTQYGNRYHSDRECTEIHHDYKKVPLSEVEGTMSQCSKE